MNFKHGRRSRSKKACITYSVWQSIKTRCYNKNSKDYSQYGGAGVKMCSRWKNDFNLFLKDMGERPSVKYTIDRINNKKGYTPSNCRWATIFEQNQNRQTPKNNTSGYKCINKTRKGVNKIEYWEVRVQRYGKRCCIGTFKTLKGAIKARDNFLKALTR